MRLRDTHTHTHTHTYTHIYTCTHTYKIHIHMHTHTHTHAHAPTSLGGVWVVRDGGGGSFVQAHPREHKPTIASNVGIDRVGHTCCTGTF